MYVNLMVEQGVTLFEYVWRKETKIVADCAVHISVAYSVGHIQNVHPMGVTAVCPSASIECPTLFAYIYNPGW